MYLHILFFVFLAVDWILALLWVASTLTALRMLPRIPDLLDEKYAAPIPSSQTPLISVIVPARDEAQAGVTFGRACDLGVQEACGSLIAFMKKGGSNVLGSACDRGDGASCFILGSLFSGGAGVPQNPVSAFELFQKSCDSGWWRGCGRLGVSYLNGQGTAVNPSLAIENFEKGCTGRNAASCMEAGQFYQDGKLGLKVEALARQRFQQACDLGLQSACALPNPAR